MKMIVLLIVSLLIVAVVYGMSADNIDRHVVKSFDLDRYLGDWYEIARFDNSFEQGLVDVRASYCKRSDGLVEVVNSGTDMRAGERKTAKGKAKSTSVAGRLRVSFFWFFYSDYNVMELDKDYQWAVVGSRSSKYLWILSRTPHLPDATLNHILSLVERRGYKSENLLFLDKVSQ